MSQKAIRAVLKANPDGLTVTQAAKLIKLHRNSVHVAIKAMPDVYIDRWTQAKAGKPEHVPIYIAVNVPENAPMPD